MRVGYRMLDYTRELTSANRKIRDLEKEVDLLANENERLLDLLQALEDGGPPIPQYRHPPEDRDAEPSRD
jgi:hypothetical protein